MPAEYAAWDDFIQRSPQGTLFHSRIWLDAACVPYQLYGFFKGAELRGGFAASRVAKRAAGAPCTALTPYLGIAFPANASKNVTTISSNKEAASAFAAFLRREFDSVQFRFPPEVNDLQPFLWEGYQVGVRYTYRLNLADLDAVLENMDATRRRNLRAAERNGVSVDPGAAFGRIMALSLKSFERQGLRPDFVPAATRFHEAVEREGCCCAFLAYDRQRTALAGVWIVWDHKRAYYLMGGYDPGAASSDAMALAMWRAIQFTALELKLPEFDFEGSMIPAVERFFRKFGGTLTPTYTVSYQKPVTLGQRLARRLARLAGLTI
jgi:hypothetical protein